MKQKIEGAIKKRKVIMAIMEIILIIACSVFIWIMTIPKDKFLASTYSYSKVEKYEINGDYLTRVMPQTDYETFIKIAQNTTKDTVSQDFSIKIYKDKGKTQEVTSGYITTEMVAVVNYKDMATNENVAGSKDKSKENVVDENNENSMNTENTTDSNSTNIANGNDEESLSDENDKEIGDNQEVSKDLEYTISVIGDLTGNSVNVYGKTVGIANYENSSVKINQTNIDSSLRGIYNYSQAKVLINSSRVVMSNGKYGINNVYGDVDIINSEISVKNGESTYGIYSNGNINIENTNIIANCTSSQPELYRA